MSRKLYRYAALWPQGVMFDARLRPVRLIVRFATEDERQLYIQAGPGYATANGFRERVSAINARTELQRHAKSEVSAWFPLPDHGEILIFPDSPPEFIRPQNPPENPAISTNSPESAAPR